MSVPNWSMQLEMGSDDDEEEEDQRRHQLGPTDGGPDGDIASSGPGAASNDELSFTIDLDKEFASSPYRDLWPFKHLNRIQSAVFPQAMQTDHNLVISSPTGGGKTLIFELAIVRLLQETATLGERRNWKVIYVSPQKALCQQRLNDWGKRFGQSFGLKVAELTGDSSQGSLREVAASQLILTTPEKFDSVSRDWRDNLYLLGSIKLLLLDEVHFVGEDPRGSTLESLVCRMKTVKTSKQVIKKDLPAARMRIVAASATLPNVEDIGLWLECPPSSIFNFDYSFRPVPLDVHVLGYPVNNNPFLFNKHLESKVLDVVAKYSDRKPTLIFCESKKTTETLATKLAETASAFSATRSNDPFRNVNNPKLRELLVSGAGVAFHHAGISVEDRATVENLFGIGRLGVLCSTSTLAVGINSPAHLVVIKGTTQWRGAGIGYQDCTVSSILQMIGRAGRPGYDERGVAVIMTSKDKQSRYESMSAGQELVESQLLRRFHEALNAEICSKVITGVEDALVWLRSTFLYVRVFKNASYYKSILGDGLERDIEGQLKGHLLKALNELSQEDVAVFGEDLSCRSKIAGQVMSKHLISYETMKLLKNIPHDITLEDLVWNISRCNEVDNPVRKADKKILNDLHKKVRFKGAFKRVQLPAQKAFVLVQACLANFEIQDFTLKLEAEGIIDNMIRITRACQEFSVETGRGGIAYMSLVYVRSLRARMWEIEREGVLKQVEGIGPSLSQKFLAGGIKTFDDILGKSPVVLESAAGRRHPFGLELIQKVQGILNSALSINVTQVASTKDFASIEVELVRDKSQEQLAAEYTYSKKTHFTLVAFSSGEERNLLLFRDVTTSSSSSESIPKIAFKVPKPIKVEDGGDKRLRITLALVSPYISLDCLSTFYPEFGQGAASTTRRILSSSTPNSATITPSPTTTVANTISSSTSSSSSASSSRKARGPTSRGKGGGRGSATAATAATAAAAAKKQKANPPARLTASTATNASRQVSQQARTTQHRQPPPQTTIQPYRPQEQQRQPPPPRPPPLQPPAPSHTQSHPSDVTPISHRRRSSSSTTAGPFEALRFTPNKDSHILDLTQEPFSLSFNSNERQSVTTSTRRRLSRSPTRVSPLSEHGLSAIHSKARETMTDQVQITRIPKAASSSSIGTTMGGPLLDKKVVGGVERDDISPPLPIGVARRGDGHSTLTSSSATRPSSHWNTPPFASDKRLRQQHEREEERTATFHPRGFSSLASSSGAGGSRGGDSSIQRSLGFQSRQPQQQQQQQQRQQHVWEVPRRKAPSQSAIVAPRPPPPAAGPSDQYQHYQEKKSSSLTASSPVPFTVRTNHEHPPPLSRRSSLSLERHEPHQQQQGQRKRLRADAELDDASMRRPSQHRPTRPTPINTTTALDNDSYSSRRSNQQQQQQERPQPQKYHSSYQQAYPQQQTAPEDMYHHHHYQSSQPYYDQQQEQEQARGNRERTRGVPPPNHHHPSSFVEESWHMPEDRVGGGTMTRMEESAGGGGGSLSFDTVFF